MKKRKIDFYGSDAPALGRAGACREGYGRVPLPCGWRLRATERQGGTGIHLQALVPEASVDSSFAPAICAPCVFFTILTPAHGSIGNAQGVTHGSS